jgi:hypothetical protein
MGTLSAEMKGHGANIANRTIPENQIRSSKMQKDVPSQSTFFIQLSFLIHQTWYFNPKYFPSFFE